MAKDVRTDMSEVRAGELVDMRSRIAVGDNKASPSADSPPEIPESGKRGAPKLPAFDKGATYEVELSAPVEIVPGQWLKPKDRHTMTGEVAETFKESIRAAKKT
jgi:hypothetical protein